MVFPVQDAESEGEDGEHEVDHGETKEILVRDIRCKLQREFLRTRGKAQDIESAPQRPMR